jgi:hypothetical protein
MFISFHVCVTELYELMTGPIGCIEGPMGRKYTTVAY